MGDYATDYADKGVHLCGVVAGVVTHLLCRRGGQNKISKLQSAAAYYAK